MNIQSNITEIKRSSLSEQVYEAIKLAIITLELEPEQKIQDKHLAERFNVSRTPVREALRRLEDEKLVESKPGSVTRITKLNTEEVKQAFVVVAALHRLAVQLAFPLVELKNIELLEQWNKDLAEGIQERNVLKAVSADDNFHNVFLDLSENNEIITALNPLIPKVRRLEYAKFGSLNGAESVQQHKKIITAVKDGDGNKAETLVEENWLNLGRQLLEELKSDAT